MIAAKILDVVLGALALVILMAWCALWMAGAVRLAQALPLDGEAMALALIVAAFVGLGAALWTTARVLGFRRL